MSRSARNVVNIVGTLALLFVVSLIVYYIGKNLAPGLLAGGSGVKLNEWQGAYQTVVSITAGIMCGIYLIYYIVLSFFDEGFNAKRMFWGVLLFFAIVIAFAMPWIYARINKLFITGISISLIFATFYGLIFFWGGTIFTTPILYKYIPIGAKVIRKK